MLLQKYAQQSVRCLKTELKFIFIDIVAFKLQFYDHTSVIKENIMMKNDSSFTENNYPVNEVASTLVPEGSRANSFNENPTVDDFSRSMEAVNQVFEQDRNLQSKLNEISGSLAGKLPPSENAGQLVKDYIAGKSNLSSRDFLCDSALSSQQCEKENTDVKQKHR